MYATCHVCDAAFPANATLSSLRVGRRLAYHADRGRLWVVCGGCGEWNLVPLEERWEAIEEAERVARGAEARAASGHVGLVRTRDLELIRIGDALRDELANWRYGPRLRRRHRRAAVATTVAGVACGGILGAAVLAGVAAGGLVVPLWCAAAGVAYAAQAAGPLVRRVGPRRDARFVTADGREHRLPYGRLHQTRLDAGTLRRGIELVVVSPFGLEEPLECGRDDALRLLYEILPRLNWQGATAVQLGRATRLVDEAEASAEAAARRGSRSAPWERIAIRDCGVEGRFARMNNASRFALEMAVTEEVERRAMAGEAESLVPTWQRAEEVAGIADDLLLPPEIGERLARERQLRGRAVRDGG